MLTLKQLRDDKALAIARLAKKGVDAAPIIAKIEELDDKRKAIQAELDNCLAEQNKAAKQIGALMGQGKRDEARSATTAIPTKIIRIVISCTASSTRREALSWHLPAVVSSLRRWLRTTSECVP